MSETTYSTEAMLIAGKRETAAKERYDRAVAELNDADQECWDAHSAVQDLREANTPLPMQPDLPEPSSPSHQCGRCGRFRTPEDVQDYSFMQVLYGNPVGWYSDDDGEMCPECMRFLLTWNQK